MIPGTSCNALTRLYQQIKDFSDKEMKLALARFSVNHLINAREDADQFDALRKEIEEVQDLVILVGLLERFWPEDGRDVCTSACNLPEDEESQHGDVAEVCASACNLPGEPAGH